MRRRILLFVKYPEPGKVKTRLAAVVGPEKAVEIYRRLVAEVIARLPAADELQVLFDPAEQQAEVEAWIGGLCPEWVVRYAPQAAGDLGVRLESAFATAFHEGCERVAVIGSDCVEMTGETFRETWDALETGDCVIGPSHDGGYYLLALKQPCAALFHGIAWSTAGVFAQTMDRARAAGLRVHQLPTLHDVDCAEDWHRAAQQLRVES